MVLGQMGPIEFLRQIGLWHIGPRQFGPLKISIAANWQIRPRQINVTNKIIREEWNSNSCKAFIIIG